MITDKEYLNKQLSIATENGEDGLMNRFLDYGADINSKNEKGETPLITAIKYYTSQQRSIVSFLLEKGADINIEHGRFKYRPIDIAKGFDTVEMLLDKGADVNSIYGGWTPLHKAVKDGNASVIKLLLERGANIEAVVNNNPSSDNFINARYYDFTPLMIAVFDHEYDICELLINLGANVNYETTHGKTCLHIARERDNNEIVELLIKNGVDVNHKDIEGRTALMYACMYADSKSYEDVIRLLIQKGADINIRDSAGYDVFDYISSGTGILRGEVKQFDRNGSIFRNKHMDDIIDLLIDKIISDVQAMEETLEKKGMEKLAARTIAIEHFDPRSLSVHSEMREEHRYRKSKKGGKHKSKRSRTRRNKR